MNQFSGRNLCVWDTVFTAISQFQADSIDFHIWLAGPAIHNPYPNGLYVNISKLCFILSNLFIIDQRCKNKFDLKIQSKIIGVVIIVQLKIRSFHDIFFFNIILRYKYINSDIENNNHKIDVFEYVKNIDNITKILGIISKNTLFLVFLTKVNIYHIYIVNIVTRKTENLIGHQKVAWNLFCYLRTYTKVEIL